MKFLNLLFANKISGLSDPHWVFIVVISWAVLLLILGIWGRKFVSKEKHKALYKTLKKSAFGLKFFAIIILVLLWFRLESLRVFSMKFWWALYLLCFVCFAFFKCRYYSSLRKRIRQGD